MWDLVGPPPPRVPKPADCDRYRRRLRRLYAMERSYRQAKDNLVTLRDSGGLGITEVRIRDEFVYRAEPAPEGASDRRLPAREHRSPAARLVTPRGGGLRLMLIALFEAQVRLKTGRRADNPTPLSVAGDHLGWTDLFASSAVDSSGRTFMTVAAKKERSLAAAIKQLEKEELVVLPNGVQRRNRQQGFLLMNEAGRRKAGANLEYRVPGVHRAGDSRFFSVPISVFTQGWIHVLDDTELLFLLVLAHYHRGLPGGFRIESDIRVRHIGLGPDAYEAHVLLSELGIVEVTPDPSRRANGTVEDYSTGGSSLPHELKFLPAGLETDGLGSLTRQLEDLLIRAGVDLPEA